MTAKRVPDKMKVVDIETRVFHSNQSFSKDFTNFVRVRNGIKNIISSVVFGPLNDENVVIVSLNVRLDNCLCAQRRVKFGVTVAIHNRWTIFVVERMVQELFSFI